MPEENLFYNLKIDNEDYIARSFIEKKSAALMSFSYSLWNFLIENDMIKYDSILYFFRGISGKKVIEIRFRNTKEVLLMSVEDDKSYVKIDEAIGTTALLVAKELSKEIVSLICNIDSEFLHCPDLSMEGIIDLRTRKVQIKTYKKNKLLK